MNKERLPRKKDSALTSVDEKNIDALYQKASTYIDQARQPIHRTIDTEMVKAYWCIGRDIVEEKQPGEKKGRIWQLFNGWIVRKGYQKIRTGIQRCYFAQYSLVLSNLSK